MPTAVLNRRWRYSNIFLELHSILLKFSISRRSPYNRNMQECRTQVHMWLGSASRLALSLQMVSGLLGSWMFPARGRQEFPWSTRHSFTICTNRRARGGGGISNTHSTKPQIEHPKEKGHLEKLHIHHRTILKYNLHDSAGWIQTGQVTITKIFQGRE